MTKNILLTLFISLLAATIGFTSCDNTNKGSLAPVANLIIDSVIEPVQDTTSNRITMADTSWHKAAESMSKTSPVPQDTTKKSSMKPTMGQPKMLAMGNPYRPQQLINGLDKAKNGDLRGAIVDFDSCIVKNYKNYNAYFYKAKAQIELNEPQNALPNLDRAIEYDQSNPVYYYYRGKLYFDARNTEKASADFEKAISLKPDFADALNYRGVINEVKGKHAEAIKDYNAAIAANPKYALAYYNKGTSEAGLELYQEAKASFSKCLELDPTKVMGFMNRGNCYVMLKDYKSAITDYTTAVTLDPNNADAFYNRGAAYQLSGDKNSCTDWRKAQSMGNKKAEDMLKEYCK